jgi:hypothetical protein
MSGPGVPCVERGGHSRRVVKNVVRLSSAAPLCATEMVSIARSDSGAAMLTQPGGAGTKRRSRGLLRVGTKKNPKSETPNPKQIQNQKWRKSKTEPISEVHRSGNLLLPSATVMTAPRKPRERQQTSRLRSIPQHGVVRLFRILNLGFGICFGFRISDFRRKPERWLPERY